MNYLKALGLAAVGMVAMMSFAWAGSASATVWCTTNDFECEAGWDEPVGTKADASATGTWTIKSGGSTLSTCTGSTEKGELTSTGGIGVRVRWKITEFTYSGCTTTTKTISNGSVEFERISGTSNANPISKEMELTIITFGVSCSYGTGAGTDLGTFEGGNPPVTNVSATLSKTAGGFICPATVEIAAKYITTSPSPLWPSDH